MSPAMTGRASAMITVGVVHGNLLVSSGIRRILEQQNDFTVVAECDEMDAAVAMAVARRPRLIILGSKVQGLVQGVPLVRQAAAGSAIILVTDTRAENLNLSRLFSLGVSAVLEHPHSPDSLVNALRVVADGKNLILPSRCRDVLASTHEPSPPEDQVSIALVNNLSTRECEILCHIAYGMSNSRIAARLSISEHTVKSHIKRVINKLQCRNRGEAALIAFRSRLVT